MYTRSAASMITNMDKKVSKKSSMPKEVVSNNSSLMKKPSMPASGNESFSDTSFIEDTILKIRSMRGKSNA